MKARLILICFISIITGYYLAAGVDAVYHHYFPKNKILVCISSFKRPLLLSGQIIRFQNQTYSDFDISVSIKGAPEKMVRNTFMQEWQPMLKSKKLRVRFDVNKGQLSNLLDTVRDIDISRYDYFCKVDDDDWYAPAYLQEVNAYLIKQPGVMVSETTNTTVLADNSDTAYMEYYNGELAGPTMCMSRKMIEALLALEQDPAALEPLYSQDEVNLLKNCCEDRLINEIANLYHSVQNRETSPHQVIYGRQYPSITRNKGYLK